MVGGEELEINLLPLNINLERMIKSHLATHTHTHTPLTPPPEPHNILALFVARLIAFRSTQKGIPLIKGPGVLCNVVEIGRAHV